jgi:hypothetical protein
MWPKPVAPKTTSWFDANNKLKKNTPHKKWL